MLKLIVLYVTLIFPLRSARLLPSTVSVNGPVLLLGIWGQGQDLEKTFTQDNSVERRIALFRQAGH